MAPDEGGCDALELRLEPFLPVTTKARQARSDEHGENETDRRTFWFALSLSSQLPNDVGSTSRNQNQLLLRRAQILSALFRDQRHFLDGNRYRPVDASVRRGPDIVAVVREHHAGLEAPTATGGGRPVHVIAADAGSQVVRPVADRMAGSGPVSQRALLLLPVDLNLSTSQPLTPGRIAAAILRLLSLAESQACRMCSGGAVSPSLKT